VSEGRGAVSPLGSPQAPRVGLIASARVEQPPARPAAASDSDPVTRWEAGFAWEPVNVCTGGGVADPCGTDALTASDSLDQQEYNPVLLWKADKCTSKGRVPRDPVARVRQALTACTSKLLAGELWEGTLAVAKGFPNRFLADPEANTLTDGAVSEASAIACLEEGLAACSCGTGMIHVTPGMMIRIADHGLIERFGNVFRTANDTIVVADAGYTGTGPEGQPASNGSVWAYATDMVDVRLGPIVTYPDSDAAAMTIGTAPDNTLTYRAQRLAAATWDGCCHLAVEVDIPVCADMPAS